MTPVQERIRQRFRQAVENSELTSYISPAAERQINSLKRRHYFAISLVVLLTAFSLHHFIQSQKLSEALSEAHIAAARYEVMVIQNDLDNLWIPTSATDI